MALQELVKLRQLQHSAEEISGTRYFHITGYTSVATLPLNQLLTSFPLGLLWGASGSAVEQIPNLRVMAHEIKWEAETKQTGIVHYSTRASANRDIRYGFDTGFVTEQELYSAASPLYTSRSTTRLEASQTMPVEVPTTIFSYERTECHYGWWRDGTLYAWGTAGTGTCGWDEIASSSATSQRNISMGLQGKVNLQSFLDRDTGTVRYLGHTVNMQGPMYAGAYGSLAIFTILYRFEIRSGGFTWRNPQSETLEQKYLRGNFNTLGLVWPRSGNAL